MPQSNVLPVIIKGQYQGGDAFAQLVQDARRSGDQAKQAFENSFSEIGRIAKQAVGGGLTSSGSVDVGVGQFRQAAAEATAYRTSLESIGRTATQLAARTGDTSAATRTYLAALNAQTIEARESERAAQAQLTTYTRLQGALNDNRADVDRLTASYRALEQARNADNIAAAAAEVRNRRFTEFQQDQGIGPAVSAGSAQASAAVFEENARAAASYANNLELVRRAIDPTRVAQQQLDAALTRADTAFEQGAISAREYGLAVNAAADNYQFMVQGAQSGAAANHLLARSQSNLRQATVQSGQQLQDIAISLYSGQQASVVFAQQLPQLAFSLSTLEGSANKTHNRIGRFATFLSGPWGVAVGLAVGVGATLIARYLGIGDAADEATKANQTFDEKINLVRNSIEDVTKALVEYNAEQRRSRELTDEAVASAQRAIKTNLDLAVSTREKLKADLENSAGLALTAFQQSGGNILNPLGVRAAYVGLQREINEAVAAQDKLIAGLKEAADNKTFEGAEYQARLATDPEFRISEEYRQRRTEIAKLIKDEKLLASQFILLKQQEKAAIKAVRDAEKDGKGTSGALSRDARVGDMTALIKELFPGAQITSTTGGRHTKGSDHYAGRAIDFVPAGGMGQYTTAEVQQILEGAGVTIRRNARGTQQLFGPGRPAAKPGDHDDHFHVAWKGQPNPESADRAAASAERAREREANQMARFAEFAADAADKTARIRQSFTDTPPALARMNDGLIALDDLSRNVEEQMRRGLDPALAEALKQKISELRPVVEDSINQPFRDMVDAGEKNAAIQDLLIAGREDEAEVLSRVFDLQEQTGAVTDEQIKSIYGIVLQERARTRELEKQNELRQRDVELVEATRDNVRSAMQDLARGGGAGAIGQAFKRQFDLVLTNQIDKLFEGLFGDFFRNEKDKALGFDLVKEASKQQVESIRETINALNDFKTSLRSTVGAVSGGGASDGFEATFDAAFAKQIEAANDNAYLAVKEIVATAPGKTADGSAPGTLSPRDFLGTLTEKIAGAVGGKEFGKSVGDAVSDGLSGNGAAYGALANGFAFGGGGSSFLGAAGGALGEKFLAKPLAKGLESIAKGLGDFAGPLGSIIGGLAGGLLGSALSSTPRASSTIGVGADGSLQVVSTRGNSASRRRASEGSAGEALDTLDRIAEALGASIDASRGSVSIGVRKGSYRVDSSGQGITKTSRGAIDFGEDSAAAIRAATLDLIQDGVLQGLRDSTQRLLQQADDLDAAIQKALDFEGVFTRLKTFKDPVGAAVDAVDKEFTRLIKLFEDAGASAQEWADLEELYGKERADAIKQAQESVLGSLRDFIADLETGDNGFSLRTRLANAKNIYDPLAAAVRAGETVDYGEFTDAANVMLQISRELYGSQQEYFDTFNDILNLSKQALAGQESVVSITEGRDTPFSNRTTVDTVPVVTALDTQSQMLLTQTTATNEWLEKLYNAVVANNNSGASLPTGTTYF